MITPAQQHWQNVMAQRAGRANEGVDHAARTAHEEVLYRLRLAQARLKGVQARSAKAAIKKELLPDFSGWIEGTLEADGGQQDEVIATLMVWAIDCGDLPLALRIGAYVVRHNLIMPDNFGRTAATVLTEEICNPVLTQAGTDADADLSAFIEPLDTLREIVTDQDMPDEVRAKLCKACAFARRGLSDADSMALSLKLLREAMHLNTGTMKTSFTHSFSPLYPLNDSATIITHHARNLTPCAVLPPRRQQKAVTPSARTCDHAAQGGKDDRHHHAIAQSEHRPRENAGF